MLPRQRLCCQCRATKDRLSRSTLKAMVSARRKHEKGGSYAYPKTERSSVKSDALEERKKGGIYADPRPNGYCGYAVKAILSGLCNRGQATDVAIVLVYQGHAPRPWSSKRGRLSWPYKWQLIGPDNQHYQGLATRVTLPRLCY